MHTQTAGLGVYMCSRAWGITEGRCRWVGESAGRQVDLDRWCPGGSFVIMTRMGGSVF